MILAYRVLLPEPMSGDMGKSRLHDRGLVGLNLAYIVSGLGWNIGICVLYRGGSSFESSISSWLLPAFDSSFELISFRVIAFFRSSSVATQVTRCHLTSRFYSH